MRCCHSCYVRGGRRRCYGTHVHVRSCAHRPRGRDRGQASAAAAAASPTAHRLGGGSGTGGRPGGDRGTARPPLSSRGPLSTPNSQPTPPPPRTATTPLRAVTARCTGGWLWRVDGSQPAAFLSLSQPPITHRSRSSLPHRSRITVDVRRSPKPPIIHHPLLAMNCEPPSLVGVRNRQTTDYVNLHLHGE